MDHLVLGVRTKMHVKHFLAQIDPPPQKKYLFALQIASGMFVFILSRPFCAKKTWMNIFVGWEQFLSSNLRKYFWLFSSMPPSLLKLMVSPLSRKLAADMFYPHCLLIWLLSSKGRIEKTKNENSNGREQ